MTPYSIWKEPYFVEQLILLVSGERKMMDLHGQAGIPNFELSWLRLKAEALYTVGREEMQNRILSLVFTCPVLKYKC